MAEPKPLQDIINKIAVTLQNGNRVWVVGNLQSFKKGELPGALPAPPLKKWGWYSGPYHYIWSRQTSYFIKSHAKQIWEITDLPVSIPVSQYEKPPLFEITGWKI